MKTNYRRRLSVFSLLLAACAIPASAQWGATGSSCSSCQVPAPVVTSVPMSSPAVCRPVAQMSPVQTTVQTAVPYTEYVNQSVTQMVPVTRRQTAQVPSVQYRNVTRYETRNRDNGRWVTRYYPNRRMSPCQVDPRPGLGGWLNRTGYEMRKWVTPQYTTKRQYVPNVVAKTVPVTRRVAVPTTRTVAYNVTEMVPRTVNRKVAVNRVRYVTRNLTTMAPTLAYQPMSIAPSVAWAPSTIATGAVGWDPFGGSLAAAPVVQSIPYDKMQVVTEDKYKQMVARDANLEPIPDRDVPRSARRDSRDDDDDAGLFDDDIDDDRIPVRSRRSSSAANEKYEKERTSATSDPAIRKSSFHRPVSRPARTLDDEFFDHAPATTRPHTQTPVTPAVQTESGNADDEFIPKEIPKEKSTFDDMEGFDDVPFDGVDFDSVNRARDNGQSTVMKRSARLSDAQNDGWKASRTSTRSPSNTNHTILVSNRTP
jgi:hypothetical protein